MHRLLSAVWYQRNHPLSLLLAPLGWLFAIFWGIKRGCYRLGLRRAKVVDCPIIVVGNIVVGGTGKTPLVAWLAQELAKRGMKPGVIARGYGGIGKVWPQPVRADSDPVVVGDESVLLARLAKCPVAVGPDRVATARALLKHADVDVIVSDDGLQHLRLPRKVEIAVVDGVRRHGNGRCLPAGPLREPVSRLRSVDLVVANGGALRGEFAMTLRPQVIQSLYERDSQQPISALSGTTIHAVCGIGNPTRFFETLRQCGADIIEHPFPDHHRFSVNDLSFGDDVPIVMTEKDAVKCERFARPEYWYLSVKAVPNESFGERVMNLLEIPADG